MDFAAVEELENHCKICSSVNKLINTTVGKYTEVIIFIIAPGSPVVPGKVMTFSSYPGMIFSGDDFYMLSSGLVSSS